MSGVWVLGGYQSDFARHLTREGAEISDLVAETVAGTLEAAGVDAAQVGVVHVGNAFGQLFTGQGHLGAMPATVHPGLAGRPAARHEAACASGSIAVLAALAELSAGFHDVALVLGAEVERSVDGLTASQHLGAASWVGHEGQEATHTWPWMFDRLLEEYDRRHGVDLEHLAWLGQNAFANARRNPLAQTRGWQVPALTGPDADPAANPPVEGRVRRYDSSQVTDGGAGVVLVSDRWLREHPGARPWGRIAGWGHRTVSLEMDAKLAASRGDEYVVPHVRATALDSFARAGVTVEDLDLVETHDCFTISAYMAVDHLGITAPGESWRAVEDGSLALGGRLPLNPSGGLIGVGHPVGATGVRMLLDASRQVSGRAAENQVEGARTAATLNIGGSTATTVSLVVTSVDD